MKLNRTRLAGLMIGLTALAIFPGINASLARAAAQDVAPPVPKYTKTEYDAEQAAAAEKSPQLKIKLLDDFVAKYPNSELLPFAYQEYIKAYQDTHNWSKVVDSEDKLLTFPNLDKRARIQALYVRAATVEYAYKATDPNAKEQMTKAREAAAQGLKELNEFAKPAEVTDEQFAAFKKQLGLQFNTTSGFASLQLKDFTDAVAPLKAVLAMDPSQAVAEYRLGQAYLQQKPPQSLDGFWALARAISLKFPNQAAVQKYMRQEMINYQLPSCETQIDAQLKELLALAATSADRPATYSIPSAADLAKVRESANIETVLGDFKAGGDKGKLTWLAVCSGEFPEALGKAFEVIPGANPVTDPTVVKAFVATKQEDLDASTAPNSELKITGQAAAARLEKGGVFRFGGALADYTPEPLLIKWDKVKVNEEDIPAEKKTPAKHAAKTPAKHPGKKKPS